MLDLFDLIEKYNKLHMLCPQCKTNTKLAQTIAMNIPGDLNQGYIDYNSVICECGWRGIVDDLIEDKYIISNKFIEIKKEKTIRDRFEELKHQMLDRKNKC